MGSWCNTIYLYIVSNILLLFVRDWSYRAKYWQNSLRAHKFIKTIFTYYTRILYIHTTLILIKILKISSSIARIESKSVVLWEEPNIKNQIAGGILTIWLCTMGCNTDMWYDRLDVLNWWMDHGIDIVLVIYILLEYLFRI